MYRVEVVSMPNSTINNRSGETLSRSSRNSRLYKEVYGEYGNLDNLPIEDNTRELDMDRLRELVYNNDKGEEHREIREALDVLDVRKRNIDTNRVYDINEMLEKAKYENNKLKDLVVETKSSRNILSTLEIPCYEEVEEEKDEETLKEDENLYMTREFKFKELNDKIKELNNNVMFDEEEEELEEDNNDSDLSLDLLSDLKPVGNTIITKPITSDNSDYKGDMHSEDTRDIDIIKPSVVMKNDEFFTNSYEFSKKDFNFKEDEEFFEEKRSGNFWKVLLLILAILIFSFVIVYFVLNYGIGV